MKNWATKSTSYRKLDTDVFLVGITMDYVDTLFVFICPFPIVILFTFTDISYFVIYLLVFCNCFPSSDVGYNHFETDEYLDEHFVAGYSYDIIGVKHLNFYRRLRTIRLITNNMIKQKENRYD